MFKCKICEKEFNDGRKLGGHMMTHVKNGSTIKHEESIKKYNKSKNKCNYCHSVLDYNKRNNKFCSSSCSASFNNIGRKKQDVFCNGCNKNLGSRRQNKKYCSNKCQREFEKKNNIKLWLESGEAILSSGKNHYVREYIRREQNNQCDICHIDPIWNNKSMVFILDHISGDSTNNSRENLRLICSNCDSQLDTYKAKNKGMGRYSRLQRYFDGKKNKLLQIKMGE